MDARLITWEVMLDGGNVLREATGSRYPDIPRARVKHFRLVLGSETLFEVPVWTFFGFRYRRDVAADAPQASRFKFGWSDGPAWCLDPSTETLYDAVQGFHTDAECHPTCAHPPGAFYPPVDIEAEVGA